MAKPSQADENSDARRAGHGGHHSSSRPREGVVMAETGARRIRRSAARRRAGMAAGGPRGGSPSGQPRCGSGSPRAIRAHRHRRACCDRASGTPNEWTRGPWISSPKPACGCSVFPISKPPASSRPAFPVSGQSAGDLDLADDGHDGHRQQHPQRGPQLTGQHRQGMHPMRAHRVRAHHLQPPCRFVPRQAWRSAAQPGQDIIGWLRGALVTGDGQRRLPPGQP